MKQHTRDHVFKALGEYLPQLVRHPYAFLFLAGLWHMDRQLSQWLRFGTISEHPKDEIPQKSQPWVWLRMPILSLPSFAVELPPGCVMRGHFLLSLRLFGSRIRAVLRPCASTPLTIVGVERGGRHLHRGQHFSGPLRTILPVAAKIVGILPLSTSSWGQRNSPDARGRATRGRMLVQAITPIHLEGNQIAKAH